MSRDRGAVALVLHSHMPYVEGFGTWPFGEEWLWEAVACVYLPLLDLLEELDAPLTLGVTPVLCDQLETLPGAAGDRLLGFLEDVRAGIHAEDARGLAEHGEHELAAEVRRAAGDYSRAAQALRETGGRDLVARLRALGDRGAAELWTSAASHAVLPLVATDAGVRMQLATAAAGHERRFGRHGGGFWLPECAYAPGLEYELGAQGMTTTCVDQTAAWGLGSPEQLEPVLTAAGVVALPIDWEAVCLVWDDSHGYPVNGTYRDYHRRTVHDLRPWANDGGAYRPAAAAALALEHAADFVARAIERLDRHAAERGRPGLLCCALDTELLGHWWYEGQLFLRGVVEEASARGLELVSAGAAAQRVEPVERELAPSSWGTGKDLSTWDSPRVAELAFAARRAELRTVAAAPGPPEARPALARAARELLALQASDWAFQLTRDLSAGYPLERMAGHGAANDAALRAVSDSASVPEPALRNLAPDLDLAPLLSH